MSPKPPMMKGSVGTATKMVESLGGSVPASELGVTLMHEHIFLLSPAVQVPYPGFGGWDAARETANARAALLAAAKAGVKTIVDVTTLETGRDIRNVLAAAKGTGLTIIVSSGMQTEDTLVRPLRLIGAGTASTDADPLYELFMRDVRIGIQGTDIRAGVLKCATDRAGLTPDVRRVIVACARVHRETGVPITTHTHAAGHTGLVQQQVLRAHGVDLASVVIGHCGDSTDLDYLERLIDGGSMLGLDRFGDPDPELPTLEQRVQTTVELCRRGYANRLVLSHDHACFADWASAETRARQATGGFRYLHDVVLPMLESSGVGRREIHAMLVENPARFFGGSER